MGKKATSREVAERAGVSQSAVSRVFGNGAAVSREMDAKVRWAAAELGYRPNVLARAMKSGDSRIIGLVVAYLENYFYNEAFEKLSIALQTRGYHVMMFMASQTAGNVDTVMEEILDYQVDGIILASVELSSKLAEQCKLADVPVVLFNRGQDRSDISSVTSDNRAGGRKVAELFVRAGMTRPGYIAGWEEASTQRDREKGFREGLNAAGVSLFAREVGNYDFKTAQEAARRLFAVPPHERPDSVFVANDHMAFAVMDVLRYELDLRLPNDVSLVGYDDVPLASWAAYDLTTVRQRIVTMVDETVTILIDQIEQSERSARRIHIDGPLILRSSAKVPDAWKN